MTVIFVFGSNRAGRHGKGAALTAYQEWGAVRGRGEGLQGHSYAIPTKDERLRTLPLEAIAAAVARFLAFTQERPDLTFMVTPIGTGLAGYKATDIAPMFKDVPDNVRLPVDFTDLLAPTPRATG